MYSGKFNVSVIVNGQVAVESKDGSVSIPFGSQYTLKLHNKNGRRAAAKIFIDDENVSDGGFIIQAHSFVEIKNPHNNTNGFKFVSLESHEAAQAGKSDNSNRDKGVIRVEFKLEKEYYHPPVVKKLYDWLPRTPYTWNNEPAISYNSSCISRGVASYASNNTTQENLAGCTVQGNYTGQKFTEVYMDLENDDPVVIQLVLRGYVNHNKYCPTCGHEILVKAANFCVNCGGKLS